MLEAQRDTHVDKRIVCEVCVHFFLSIFGYTIKCASLMLLFIVSNSISTVPY